MFLHINKKEFKNNNRVKRKPWRICLETVFLSKTSSDVDFYWRGVGLMDVARGG